jgi:tripartite-type tricarboxylate transporter receptor subunit TctC
MRNWHIGVAIGAGLALLAAVNAGRAEENFPNRPIRLIVPYSVGSVVDVFGRIVAASVAEQLKGTILNEPKSGFTASPSLNVALKWDPERDFIPIGQVCTGPNFFVVPKTLPVTSVKEFVALAKEKPGKLNYAHPGKGSTGHLGFELFKKLADIDVSGIGYRGYPQMISDISTGLITATFLSANQALAQSQTGTIRIIAAINNGGRSKYFPDVPTMAEQGFPDAQVTPWFGIVVPKGTPEPIVDRISKALDTALANPDVQNKLDLAGCPPKPASRAEFAGIIKADIALWAKVVKDAGIPPD